MWIRIAVLALLISAPLAGRADPRLYSPDGAIETSSDTITEPLVEGGMLLARNCPACRSKPLRLNAGTRLFIGRSQVTVDEFNKFLQGGGAHDVGIFYDKTANTVTRIVVVVNAPRPAGRN